MAVIQLSRKIRPRPTAPEMGRSTRIENRLQSRFSPLTGGTPTAGSHRRNRVSISSYKQICFSSIQAKRQGHYGLCLFLWVEFWFWMDRRTVPGSPKNFLEAISKKIQNYVFYTNFGYCNYFVIFPKFTQVEHLYKSAYLFDFKFKMARNSHKSVIFVTICSLIWNFLCDKC